MTFILAQIFGLLATTFNIIGVQSKKKKQILIFFIISNLCFAINFIFLKSYTGAIINFIAAIQTFINYQYERKEKTLPNYLITIYLATVITCGVAFYRQVIDILPIVCSVLYTLTIVQKKEKNIRSLTLITTILWLIYDFIVGAYTATISNIIFCISNLIAIFKYDIKGKRKKRKRRNGGK